MLTGQKRKEKKQKKNRSVYRVAAQLKNSAANAIPTIISYFGGTNLRLMQCERF